MEATSSSTSKGGGRGLHRFLFVYTSKGTLVYFQDHLPFENNSCCRIAMKELTSQMSARGTPV
eukprot:m.66198 g.66198  ORF g.66198 m.66198 type:complete len:63 (-) comp8183_c0_seq3:921-1109(-)